MSILARAVDHAEEFLLQPLGDGTAAAGADGLALFRECGTYSGSDGNHCKPSLNKDLSTASSVYGLASVRTAITDTAVRLHLRFSTRSNGGPAEAVGQ